MNYAGTNTYKVFKKMRALWVKVSFRWRTLWTLLQFIGQGSRWAKIKDKGGTKIKHESGQIVFLYLHTISHRHIGYGVIITVGYCTRSSVSNTARRLPVIGRTRTASSWKRYYVDYALEYIGTPRHAGIITKSENNINIPEK